MHDCKQITGCLINCDGIQEKLQKGLVHLCISYTVHDSYPDVFHNFELYFPYLYGGNFSRGGLIPWVIYVFFK